MSPLPGDGGLGFSWFAVELTSEEMAYPNLGSLLSTATASGSLELATVEADLGQLESYASGFGSLRLFVPGQGTGGGETFTHGGGQGISGVGITGEDFEVTIPCKLDLRFISDFESSFAGSVSAYRDAEFAFVGIVSANRDVEFVTPGVRLSAERWNRLLREDEELLALL